MALSAVPLLDMPSDIDPASLDQEQQSVRCVLGSRLFSKATLLSSFLVYICRRALADGQVRISEHEIAVQVFHRPPDFDPREDNIVRTYARHLRKRLKEYYVDEGINDDLHIEIPKGGYVPVFIPREVSASADVEAAFIPGGEVGGIDSALEPALASWIARPAVWMAAGLLLVIYSLAIFAVAKRAHLPLSGPAGHSPLHPLWTDLFSYDRDTFIVPSDVGFVILQQVNRRAFSLDEYLNWNSVATSDKQIAMSYLKDQTYTSVLSLNIVSSLQRLPEEIPDRFVIRAARNLRFEDLRDGNAILLGSNYSNPWDELFSDRLNFYFVNQPKDDRYWIVNRHPLSGERPVYEPQTNAYLHRTYAVIAFIPNLNNTGHVLLLQGLDASGTQAAADMLFNSDVQQSILSPSETAGGHIHSFELLIEATSLDSNSQATNSHVVATRFYP